MVKRLRTASFFVWFWGLGAGWEEAGRALLAASPVRRERVSEGGKRTKKKKTQMSSTSRQGGRVGFSSFAVLPKFVVFALVGFFCWVVMVCVLVEDVS